MLFVVSTLAYTASDSHVSHASQTLPPLSGPTLQTPSLEPSIRVHPTPKVEPTPKAELSDDMLIKTVERAWIRTTMSTGAERAQALKTTQREADRLPARLAYVADFFRGQCYLALGSYALAFKAFKQSGVEEAQAIARDLGRMNHTGFRYLGAVKGPSGMRLDVYDSVLGPPIGKDGGIHHSSEIVVRDADGHHVETFAITTQSLPPGSPPTTFLDRIDADGLDTVEVYERGTVPDPIKLANQLAKP